MRKILYSSLSVIPVLFFLSHTPGSKKTFIPEASGKWSGTLTLTEKVVWNEGCINSSSERTVRLEFTNALPTLNRDDGLTDFSGYTDNKGTGSSEFHSEGNLCGQTGKTDCTGTGEAELHNVTVRPWDNTYDIEAIAPPCTGTNSDGSTYGPETVSITVSNEPLTNKNSLHGTKTTNGQVPGTTATVTSTVTWHLEKEREPIDLIVTPVDYDTWLPEPGKDENREGRIMNINLKLQRRDGKPLTNKAVRFELQLLQTSAEPGIAINYPTNPGPPKPDLRFIMPLRYDTANQGQFLSIDCTSPCINGSAKLGSYDGGGWTTMTAVAILQDSTLIKGTLLVPGGAHEIRIPKRDANSRIAKAWLAANGNPGDLDDNDESDGNTNNGDGLTAYEEYRGVISKTKHTRLKAKKKEIGVRVKIGELGLFDNGMSWLEKAADITVIRFFENEINDDRMLNRNHNYGNTYQQYVQRLEKGRNDTGVVGENRPITTLAKLPKQSTLVVIDITQIQNSYRNQQMAAAAARVRLPYTQAEVIANTVAHELAHGLNVDHHGLPSDRPNITIPAPPTVDIYHVYSSNGTEIFFNQPYPIRGSIGTLGNDASGDTSCVMTYTSLYQWAFTVGGDGSLIYSAVPLLPMGRNLCTSNAGNGINATSRFFGDARTGKCLSRIKLK